MNDYTGFKIEKATFTLCDIVVTTTGKTKKKRTQFRKSLELINNPIDSLIPKYIIEHPEDDDLPRYICYALIEFNGNYRDYNLKQLVVCLFLKNLNNLSKDEIAKSISLKLDLYTFFKNAIELTDDYYNNFDSCDCHDC